MSQFLKGKLLFSQRYGTNLLPIAAKLLTNCQNFVNKIKFPLVLFTIWPQTWNSMIVEHFFRVCESVFKRETPLFSAMWNKSTAHCCQTIDKLPRISSFFTPLRGFLLPLQGTHTTGYPGRNY